MHWVIQLWYVMSHEATHKVISNSDEAQQEVVAQIMQIGELVSKFRLMHKSTEIPPEDNWVLEKKKEEVEKLFQQTVATASRQWDVTSSSNSEEETVEVKVIYCPCFPFSPT